MSAPKNVWVVSYYSDPDTAVPVGVYDHLEDAKTHAPDGEWTEAYGVWSNGPFEIVACPHWEAT